MSGFRKFLLRGNVVDLAVGIVIGAAFTAVVQGFVKAFLTPVIGVITSQTGDFSTYSHKLGGVEWPIGQFVSAAISFLLIAAVVYFCVVLPVSKVSARFATKTDIDAPKKDCPECLSSIPAAATRCSFCTIELPVHAVSFPKQ